jgi:hypothetical protein
MQLLYAPTEDVIKLENGVTVRVASSTNCTPVQSGGRFIVGT